MSIESINPFNNKVLKRFKTYTDAKIIKGLLLSDKTFKIWRDKSFDERSALMKNCAEVLSDNKDVYGRLITLEMGKPIKESRAEIEKCALTCSYYAENAENFLKDEPIASDAGKSFIRYEPLGAVLAVMPWNFPFWQVFRFAVPAIMAGNVAILKHASNVPQCALAIEASFIKAGFPKGVFQTLLIGANKVEQIIKNDIIKAVTLTGSEAAGSQVAQIAGKHIKKTVLELGGSDPFIVLKDANMEQAIDTAVRSRMINTGQSCIAAKRFIVVEEIADTFIKLLKNSFEQLKMGDPLDEATEIGPMARKDLAQQLLKQVSSSVSKGAKIIAGGNMPDKEGAFFNPTILTEVKPGMPAFDEEMFGPVASVIVVKDEDEAVEIANTSKFGLGGSIWTENTERGVALAGRVESGAIFVNGLVKSDPRLPFGGIKRSGYGRELSYLGIREFVNQKTIWVK